jgi:hypothetical protein
MSDSTKLGLKIRCLATACTRRTANQRPSGGIFARASRFDNSPSLRLTRIGAERVFTETAVRSFALRPGTVTKHQKSMPVINYRGSTGNNAGVASFAIRSSKT